MRLGDLDLLKAKLDIRRPLNETAVEKISHTFDIEIIYNSNAIEGNTLTLNETMMVVDKGITINGKGWKDHLEANNLANATYFLKELVSLKVPLTALVLKQIHQLVLAGLVTRREDAGDYRKVPVTISGSDHVPPPAHALSEAVDALFLWYEEYRQVLHPVELAAKFHFRLVYIHPFIDGNGRTARLCMNLILMQAGFPPAIVSVERRQDYYRTLEVASVLGDQNEFIEFITTSVGDTINKYLTILDGGETSEKGIKNWLGSSVFNKINTKE